MNKELSKELTNEIDIFVEYLKLSVLEKEIVFEIVHDFAVSVINDFKGYGLSVDFIEQEVLKRYFENE